MPNIKSAKKRVRQTEKRTLRNRVRKERLRKSLKAFNSTLANEGADKAGELLSQTVRAVDIAGRKGILHKNTVNRKKSRLAKAINRARQAS